MPYLNLMKHIIVISSSLRAHSNSEALAGEFVRGAREAGHQVELVSLRIKISGSAGDVSLVRKVSVV